MKTRQYIGHALNAIYIVAAYWMTLGNTFAESITGFMIGFNFSLWGLMFLTRRKTIPLLVKQNIEAHTMPFDDTHPFFSLAIDLFVLACCAWQGYWVWAMLVTLAACAEQHYRYLTYSFMEHMLGLIVAAIEKEKEAHGAKR